MGDQDFALKPWKAPAVSGRLLRVAANLAEGALGGLIARKLLRDVGVEALRAAPVSAPPPSEALVFAGLGAPTTNFEAPHLPPESEPVEGPFESACDFTRAYRAGRITPAEVAERALAWSAELDARTPAMRIFIAQRADDVRAQAAASTARYQAGTPLGPLDGVPVAVKDELDVIGYPTTAGTSFQGHTVQTRDAFVVARMREAGAVLLGKANMHEIGIGISGINPHHGTCRNPYNPEHMTGGSSSGSAAAVAAGLGPIALGADGGGSVRIPAALCGVFGLKATFGRISETGAVPLCWSVAHVGPLAATAGDLALAYAAMAGADPADANTLRGPAVTLEGVASGDVTGLRLGVFSPWFESADAEVVAACEAQIKALCARGATRHEIRLPGLALARTAHVITIVSEMAASQAAHLREHRGLYGADARLSLALAGHLRATDYVMAQRHRAELFHHFMAALATVDVIVAPAVSCVSPRIPDAAPRYGLSDVALTDRVMRFAAVSNLTGLPALTCPAGVGGPLGLPVGCQYIGRPFTEALLLRIARAAERVTERPVPAVHRRLLGG